MAKAQAQILNELKLLKRQIRTLHSGLSTIKADIAEHHLTEHERIELARAIRDVKRGKSISMKEAFEKNDV